MSRCLWIKITYHYTIFCILYSIDWSPFVMISCPVNSIKLVCTILLLSIIFWLGMFKSTADNNHHFHKLHWVLIGKWGPRRIPNIWMGYLLIKWRMSILKHNFCRCINTLLLNHFKFNFGYSVTVHNLKIIRGDWSLFNNISSGLWTSIQTFTSNIIDRAMARQ